MAGYPFSAVVALAELRLALLLNAVSPGVGGVLIRGEKGSAKSTVVRALAALLPDLSTVDGCRFGCDPAAPAAGCPDGPHPDPVVRKRTARLVELPVGATEDRLLGALDLQRALSAGVRAYQPGLLAAAHRGVLYADEVNLLPDHLVDALLDAAAAGAAQVERDGISVRYPTRFLLVGTMNPEEGELRPQLLDRFGLTVTVAASRDPAERAEVVRRRLAYEADPEGFTARFATAEADLVARIAAARALLPAVTLPDAELLRIARVCAEFDVDGVRADLVTARTATALAAWRGSTVVTEAEVRDAAALALPHRRRRHPFDAPGLPDGALDDAFDAAREAEAADAAGTAASDAPAGSARPGSSATDRTPDDPNGPDGDGPDGGGPEGDGPDGGGSGGGRDGGPGGGWSTVPAGAGDPGDGAANGTAGDGATADGADGAAARDGDRTGAEPAHGDGSGGRTGADRPGGGAAADPDAYRARLFTVAGTGTGAAGRRSPARTAVGRVVRSVPDPTTLYLPGTLAAAVPHQRRRGRTEGGPVLLHRSDLRRAVRVGREGNLVLFVVDASGSMAARQRMRAVRGAVLRLLLDAYQRRDRVGLITFRGTGAELVLPPTGSVQAGVARLAAMPTGGRTPLAAGLRRAGDVLAAYRLRDPRRRPLLVVVTDGRATGAPGAAGGPPLAAAYAAADRLAGIASMVIDCESGPVRLGLAAELAGHLRADHVRLAELSADALTDTVHRHRTAGRRGTAA